MEINCDGPWFDTGIENVLVPDTAWSRDPTARRPPLLGMNGFFKKLPMSIDHSRKGVLAQAARCRQTGRSAAVPASRMMPHAALTWTAQWRCWHCCTARPRGGAAAQRIGGRRAGALPAPGSGWDTVAARRGAFRQGAWMRPKLARLGPAAPRRPCRQRMPPRRGPDAGSLASSPAQHPAAPDRTVYILGWFTAQQWRTPIASAPRRGFLPYSHPTGIKTHRTGTHAQDAVRRAYGSTRVPRRTWISSTQ